MSEQAQAHLLEAAARLLQAMGALADEVTIVGGLVPALLVPTPSAAVGRHVGTVDVDLSLAIAWDVDKADAFAPLERVLRELRFEPRGPALPNRWSAPNGVVVDFLCGVPVGFQEKDFVYVTDELAACAFSAAPLAAIDRVRVTLSIDDEAVNAWVAGLCAFLALKIDALRMRGKPRDAYDVVWILRAWGGGPEQAAAAVARSPVMGDPIWTGRLQILRAMFESPTSDGAVRYAAHFETDGIDSAQRAVEATTTVQAFTRSLDARA